MPDQSKSSDNKKKEPHWSEISVVVGCVLIPFGTIVYLTIITICGADSKPLDVITTAQQQADKAWVLRGMVREEDGTPSEGSCVWATAKDSAGNKYIATGMKTGTSGLFNLEFIPNLLIPNGSATTSVVEVRATKIILSTEHKKVVRGRDRLILGNYGRVQWTTPSYSATILIAVIFGLSLVAGYINPVKVFYWKAKHYALVFLSFLFPFTMLVSIAMALSSINVTCSPGERISLGFANIYYDTYTQKAPPEWLFSFTLPNAVNLPKQSTIGFGAPMWTLLLSVTGSTVITIALLVKHVTIQIDWNILEKKDLNGTKKNIQNMQTCNPYEQTGMLLQHQFYTLFSPLSAIFVYQIMVVAGAVSEPITVALTVLGAGAMINLLLGQAIKKAESILAN